ncbi:MAG: IS66 family transposase [Verrucomicrobiota bacterium]
MDLPQSVKNENNPEVLKLLLSSVVDHVNKLEAKVDRLEAAKAEKDQNLLNMEDALLLARKRMFGKSSEKRASSRKRDNKRQLSIHSDSLVPPPDEKEAGSLPEIEVPHKLTSEDLSQIALEYGYPEDAEWECIEGLYDESTEIDIKVESYVRKKHKRFKYRLKCTKGTEKEVIVTAPNALKIMPGAKYSVEFAIDIAIKKHLYHLPYERIRRMMESCGLIVSTKVLYGLVFFVHCYLEDIVERIRQEILVCGLCLHMDETPWPINNQKQDDGYMWIMSNQAGSYYQFEPTRSGAVAKELIDNYTGPVVTDGYSGYKSRFKNIEGLTLAFCWSHGRRKFTDIEENYPKECSEILDLIDELFSLERLAKNFEDLERIRSEQSKPIVDKIWNWLVENKMKARGESHLEKAVNYMFNHWGGLTKFLENVRIPLSNNEAERAARHSVMGRKNFYGSRTINGADVTATLYTVIESCKKVELDPKHYITMVVKEKIKGTKDIPTPLQYVKIIRLTTTV